MHHFDKNINKFAATDVVNIDNVSVYKAISNTDVTGAQGYIARGHTWNNILSLINDPRYSNIPKIQDVIMLHVWRENYYILDPCIVKHREDVSSTWLSYKMRTKRYLF